MFFSGFFLSLNNIPVYMQWLSYVAYVRYGFEGTMMVGILGKKKYKYKYKDTNTNTKNAQAIYGFEREKLVCSQAYCHFKYPHKFLEELALQDAVRDHDDAADDDNNDDYDDDDNNYDDDHDDGDATAISSIRTSS